MNIAIIDRWAIAMKATLPWYMGYLDQRNEPGERLYCRTLAVVMQDRVMAGEMDDTLQFEDALHADLCRRAVESDNGFIELNF